MPLHLLFQFGQATVRHTVSPRLSLIYGVDIGKMLLRGNPLMYHYTIQEAVGVTLPTFLMATQLNSLYNFLHPANN